MTVSSRAVGGSPTSNVTATRIMCLLPSCIEAFGELLSKKFNLLMFLFHLASMTASSFQRTTESVQCLMWGHIVERKRNIVFFEVFVEKRGCYISGEFQGAETCVRVLRLILHFAWGFCCSCCSRNSFLGGHPLACSCVHVPCTAVRFSRTVESRFD